MQQHFAKTHPVYKQFGNGFVPNLSILDCLFHVGFDETRAIAEQVFGVTSEVFVGQSRAVAC